MYDTPLLELVFRAATVHRMHNDPRMVSRAASSTGNLQWFLEAPPISCRGPCMVRCFPRMRICVLLEELLWQFHRYKGVLC